MFKKLSAFWNKPLTRSQAGVYIVIAAVLWSTSGLFIRLIPWNPFVISGIRSAFAAVIVGAVLGFKNIRFNKKILLGGFIVCFTLISFVVANTLTSAANAIALQYTSPVWTLLYTAIFMHHRPKSKDIVAILITLAGMCLFFIGDFSGGGMLGNFLAILSGMGFAGVSIISSDKSIDNFQFIFWGQIMAVTIGIPFIFFIAPPVLTVSSCLSITYMGLFQLGLGYIVFGRAMKYATPLDGTLLSIIEPLINPVWVFLVLGEMPSVWAIVGAVVVVGCITIWSVSNAKDASKEAAKEAAEEKVPANEEVK